MTKKYPSQGHEPLPYGPRDYCATYSQVAIWSIAIVVFFPIVGVILGHIALEQTKNSFVRGRELAMGSLCVGYSSLAFQAFILASWAGAFRS